MAASHDHLSWQDSKSSNLAAYAYDSQQRRLHVRFRNGTHGYCANVSPSMHREFATATSHGKFLHAHLRANDKHAWVRTQDDA
jgi:hypothetical protein